MRGAADGLRERRLRVLRGAAHASDPLVQAQLRAAHQQGGREHAARAAARRLHAAALLVAARRGGARRAALERPRRVPRADRARDRERQGGRVPGPHPADRVLPVGHGRGRGHALHRAAVPQAHPAPRRRRDRHHGHVDARVRGRAPRLPARLGGLGAHQLRLAADGAWHSNRRHCCAPTARRQLRVQDQRRHPQRLPPDDVQGLLLTPLQVYLILKLRCCATKKTSAFLCLI